MLQSNYRIEDNMKKNEAQDVRPSENVIKKLSGHFNVDRKLLLNSIKDFRASNKPYTEIATLGIELYKLLLSNGLNESDVIKPDRLLDKVEGFVYEGNLQMATDILDVIDALEVYQKTSPEGKKVYCFANEVEAQIFKNVFDLKIENIVWLFSNRPMIMSMKAKIFLDNGQYKDAEKVLGEITEINPIDFSNALLKARVYADTKLEKYKELILDAWKFAYLPKHMILYFNFLADYYIQKKQWEIAYAVISAIKMYDKTMDAALEVQLGYIESELTKTLASSKELPSIEKIVKILEKEKINALIPLSNFDVVVGYYKEHCLDKDDNPFLADFAESINIFSQENMAKKIVDEEKKKLKNKKV